MRPISHMPFTAPVRSDLPDIDIRQTAGEIAPGWEAPRSAVRRPGPSRIALYHQNFSGERTWNADINLDYPAELRETIQNQNAQAGALSTLARVQAPGSAARPIPLSHYTLQTRMVYTGTVDENGRINR